MDKLEDGGPAFPLTGHTVLLQNEGMTLRDWFAGQAMSGAIAAVGDVAYATTERIEADRLQMAVSCYDIADAMLLARG